MLRVYIDVPMGSGCMYVYYSVSLFTFHVLQK